MGTALLALEPEVQLLRKIVYEAQNPLSSIKADQENNTHKGQYIYRFAVAQVAYGD